MKRGVRLNKLVAPPSVTLGELPAEMLDIRGAADQYGRVASQQLRTGWLERLHLATVAR